MLDGINSTLVALKDVSGIEGSFVVSQQGALLGRELPPIFDDSILNDVGPRIARLYETFMSSGDDMDVCAIRFSEHMLYLRNVAKGFLCILTAASVNLPALKMAVNLAHRRITQELEKIPDQILAAGLKAFVPAVAAPVNYAPAMQAPQSETLPQQDAAVPAARRPLRMYRGKVIE